ncbi:MAG: hypothetical protein FWH10_05770 [Oscillospiraceae bacterium]|nr:hypothetical protein [Oscillospiraceae bacterium]
MKKFKKTFYLVIMTVCVIIVVLSVLIAGALHESAHIPGECPCENMRI